MSQIHTMQSTPVTNLIQGDQDACNRYSTWMRTEGQAQFDLNLSPMQMAQKMLGRQDFCWVGSVRHWIWVREFTFQNGEHTETWRWRLFASTRGWSLGIEDKPGGQTIQVGLAGLAHFIETWSTS